MHRCRIGLVISAIAVLSAGFAPSAAAQGWAVFAINNKVYRTTVGGTPEQLYEGAAAHACWSAQGSFIYFIKHSGEIWRMNNDGSDAKKISSGVVTDFNPIAAYRPDDKYLLYVQGKTFYRMDGSSGAKTPIYSGTKSYDGEIAISQDGKRLAGRDSRNDLYRIDLNPASSQYNTEVLYDTNCSSSVSPNGQYLTANMDGHTGLSIAKWSGSSVDCDKDSSCHKILTAPSGVEWDNQRFAVNSDGYVVYRHDGGKAVGIVVVSSNSKTKICNMGPAYLDFLVGNPPGPPKPPANKAPSATIDSPTDGAKFEPGDTVSYSGSATDPEDGTLSGSALSWTIDRDDDGQGAVHSSSGTSGSYTFPGDIEADTRYAVKLAAQDSKGLTASKTISVWVRPAITTNAAPAINEVSATPHPVDKNAEVTLSCSAIDPDGDTLSHAWTFGDGSTGTGASATHTYATAGSFEVEVTVDDGQGHQVTQSITVTVTDPSAPDRVVIEAETMELSGYQIEGQLIATMDSGTAVASFPGRSGRYRAEIMVVKESDGQPSVIVSTAGAQLASITYELGGSGRDPETIDMGQVVLSQGDSVEIAGQLHEGAAARVDKLVFHELEPLTPTTDGGVPTAEPDAGAGPETDGGIADPTSDASGTNPLGQDPQMRMSSGCSIARGPQAPALLLLLLLLLVAARSGRPR